MKVFAHCCSITLNNCYLLGTEDAAPGREAVLIDPGELDETIVECIESNDYALKGILITHEHIKQRGILSLKRIYDAPVYAVSPYIHGCKIDKLIRDYDILDIGSFQFEVLLVPGHTMDSAVFKIEQMLFTGDVLSAGLIGYTASPYSAVSQMKALQSKIFSLLGDFSSFSPQDQTSPSAESERKPEIPFLPSLDYTIFPCHGPPTSLESERKSNVGIQRYEQNKKRIESLDPLR